MRKTLALAAALALHIAALALWLFFGNRNAAPSERYTVSIEPLTPSSRAAPTPPVKPHKATPAAAIPSAAAAVTTNADSAAPPVLPSQPAPATTSLSSTSPITATMATPSAATHAAAQATNTPTIPAATLATSSTAAAHTAPLQIALRSLNCPTQPEAVYPRLAQQRGWEGTVTVQLTINAAGKVIAAQLLPSKLPSAAQQSLGAAALSAAQHIQCVGLSQTVSTQKSYQFVASD